MKRLTPSAAVLPLCLALVVSLTSCERDVDDVASYFKRGAVGSDGADYGLYKSSFSSASGWDLVAVVFGMADDYEFCNSLAEAMKVRYPSNNFRCERMNEP